MRPIKVGREKRIKPPSSIQQKRLQVNFTLSEYESLEQAATQNRISKSEFVRRFLKPIISPHNAT